jgi:hypothetical protein
MTTRSTIKYITAGLLLAVFAIHLSAQEVNNSLAAYMRMGIGARIIAMGEAGSTVTKDVASGYWNPAGLMMMKDFEVGTMLNVAMDNDRSYQYVAIGNRFGIGALSISWINAGVSDIDGFDESGQPTGTFSDQEHNFSLSYANRIGRFSFGVTPKFYLSSMDGETETGYGIDTGIKVDLSQYFEIGVMARDIYGKYGEEEEKVPYELSGGLALYPILGLTIAADAKMEEEEDPYFCFGAEYWTAIGSDTEADSKLSVVSMGEKSSWANVLSDVQTGLRIGYNREKFSVGTGVRFRNLQLDYVFRLNNHDIFGDDHIVSLILRF